MNLENNPDKEHRMLSGNTSKSETCLHINPSWDWICGIISRP